MTNRVIGCLFLLTAVGCTTKAPEPLPSADLVIRNAEIWTANSASPSASTLVVQGDRIAAIGDEAVLKDFDSSSAQIIDAEGRFVVPGFIDTHVHFLSSSYGLSAVQLRDADTPEEFARRIQEKAESLPKGQWILGGDWDHTLWGGELPEAAWIDELTPDHPVCVNRLDGHMVLANSTAMRIAGVDRNTADIDGGTIVRDAAGHPTGIFKDNAERLIRSHIPEPTPEQDDAAFLDGMRFVASHGVTSVHNMDRTDTGIFDQYMRIKDQHITRFYVAVDLPYWQDLKNVVDTSGVGDEWLRIGVLKGMVDGSLGSHTAAFHEPYSDQPKDKGFFLLSREELEQQVLAADAAGLHLAIHAIGDRAISELLDVFELAIEKNGPRERRLRIEHSQHPTLEDIARFKELKVIASMQPYHAIDDGRWAESVIGPERIQSTYAFRSFLDHGVTLAFGSDWSVAPPTPLEGIYAAVTRRTLDGANDPQGWVPEQKITVEEALLAYTLNGAFASFEEEIKGSLETGKLADFVILEQNLLTIDPADIRDVSVVSTFVGGRQVYPETPHP